MTDTTVGTTGTVGLLAGKAALVVGGGRGIGRAVSLTLGGAGAAVAVVDLEPDRAEAVAAELTATGARAVALAADIRDAAEVERVVRETCAQLGGIDVLVTVVGGRNAFAAWQPTHLWSDEEWDLVVGVNLRYVFLVAARGHRRDAGAGTRRRDRERRFGQRDGRHARTTRRTARRRRA